MNKPQLSVFNFSVKNQSDDTVDINVDGYIVDSPTLEIYREYWGDETSVSYKSFRDSIPTGVKTINLFVNSGGGHVGDAMAIRDFLASLENNGVTVNREGRGIVASAATYLVMGNNSRLSENCLFMIHEVSGFAYGDVSSMENQVKAMRKFNDLIVNFYSKETGLSATVIGNMMKQETWMNPEDAKEKGFVKAIGPKATLTNSITKEHWPFQNTAMLNLYNSFIPKNDPTMDTTKITDAITTGFNSLMEKLGLKDKANDENTKNAFAEFSKGITDNLKDVPDNASIEDIVNKAVAKSLESVPENFSNAIADAMKDTLTKKDLENTVTKKDLEEGLKNTLSNEAFTKEMESFKKSIIDKIGNPTNGGEQEEKKDKKKGPKNRYAAAYDEYYEN